MRKVIKETIIKSYKPKRFGRIMRVIDNLILNPTNLEGWVG